MTGMEPTIERAARVIAEHVGFLGDLDSDTQCLESVILHPVALARALDQAGLLAPGPLAEEWRATNTSGGGYIRRDRADAERDAAEIAARAGHVEIDEPPVPPLAGTYRRYVSDWLPADGIDRSEGGGRAATNE